MGIQNISQIRTNRNEARKNVARDKEIHNAAVQLSKVAEHPSLDDLVEEVQIANLTLGGGSNYLYLTQQGLEEEFVYADPGSGSTPRRHITNTDYEQLVERYSFTVEDIEQLYSRLDEI